MWCPYLDIPLPLQSGVPGQSGISHPSPFQSASHWQLWSDNLHVPLPEQLSSLPGHPLISQFAPEGFQKSLIIKIILFNVHLYNIQFIVTIACVENYKKGEKSTNKVCF